VEGKKVIYEEMRERKEMVRVVKINIEEALK
jgi:hypothetical protein